MQNYQPQTLPPASAAELHALRARVAELEHTLDATQTVLETLMDNAPIGFALHDRSLRCVRINTVLAEINGLSVEQQLGRTLSEILPSLAPFAEHAMRTVLETGTPLLNVAETGETLAPIGHQHWYTSYYPVRTQAGEIIGVGVIVVDHTAQHRADTALHESEARYRTLVEQLPMVIYTADLTELQNTRYVSPYITNLVGYTPEEWCADPTFWRTRIHPDDAERVLGAQEYFQSTLTPNWIEHRMVARDGRTVWVHDEAIIMRDEAGQAQLFLGFTQDITARKQVEAERDQLVAIVAASDDAIMAVDLHGTVLSWNAGAEQMYGFSAADMIGQSIVKTVPPERLGEVRVIIDTISRGERIDQFETVRLRKDGSTIVIAITGSPIRDAAGQIISMAVVARDVTARRQEIDAQRFLTTSGIQLAASLDPEIIFGQIVQLAIPFLGDGCAVYLHSDSGTLRQVAAQHHDPALDAQLQALNALDLAEDRAPWGVAHVIRHGTAVITPAMAGPPDQPAAISAPGRELHNALTVPLLSRGRVIGALVTLRRADARAFTPPDVSVAEEFAQRATRAITHARLYQVAQSAIERQHETLTMLEAMLANTPVGLGFVDAQLRYVQVNAALAEINAMPIAEHLGRSIRDVLPHVADVIEPVMHSILQTGAPVLNRELSAENVGAPGKTRTVLASYYPITVRAPTVWGIGVAVIDITARKQAEAAQLALERQLLETQKLESLGVLAGGIAHDFNNLLVAILGNAELALMDIPAESPAHYSIVQLQSASRQAADLTSQMLAYSGRGRFVVEPIDLNALIAELTALLHASIPKHVRLHSILAPDLPPIAADASQIRQVVMNLVLNAAEAITSSDGVVTVTTTMRPLDEAELVDAVLPIKRSADDHLIFEVNDTGAGMEAAVVSRIFEPFFTTKFTGRGLGMAAVLGIVRGHHGTLRITSQPGRGTTVTIMLPIVARAAKPAPSDQSLPLSHERGGQRPTVLIIDDELHVRSVTTRILERLGYAVLTAQHGHEGLERYRAQRQSIAAVLLDLTMPELSGEAVYQELRALDPAVRVVIMSGYSRDELHARFPDVAPLAFMQKPFTPTALANILRQILAPT